jgi:lipoprotein-releasing system permease protein
LLETRIARRYLWAARKQAHTAFLSVISMLGLAVGVATLLISIALLSGLQGQITGRLIESSPQLLVEPARGNVVGNAAAIAQRVRQLGFNDVRPYVSGFAWAMVNEQGGRPMRLRSMTIDESGDDGSDPAIELTGGFAASLGLQPGGEVTVVAPRTRLTPFGPTPVMRRYRVTRIVPTGFDENPVDAHVSHDEAANLFGTGGDPTMIEIYGDTSRAELLQEQLQKEFPAVRFKTWKEINRPLFLALRLEKIVMFATISLIIFVAALNLISSLSMLILEKRPSVGVLRTLGATEGNIRSVFMQLGLLIGLSGTLLGNLIGIGFSWAANEFHLVPLPADIYFVSYLPFRLELRDIIGVNLIAVLLSVIGTWYPSRVAARLDPIAAIREE